MHVYTPKITFAQGRDVLLVSFLALQQHRGFTILPVTVLTAAAFAAHNNIKPGHWSETQPGVEAQVVATSGTLSPYRLRSQLHSTMKDRTRAVLCLVYGSLVPYTAWERG